MTFGLGGRHRRPTREQLEQEAADVIAELVASGRPPPEVWHKAEEWRATNPVSGTSWYVPDDPTPTDPVAAPTPIVGAEFVPRVVRIPVAAHNQRSHPSVHPARRARPDPVENPVSN
ncbi:MAG TPA: hypothetical protein VM121_10315 [Acidimicrobiales bacterium]|nr:hypothetical protein [Acidimicrobiales bacterium]